MKTKYGEIKSLRDFFEWVSTNWEGEAPLSRCVETWKCKICGENIKGLGTAGAYSSDWKSIEELRKEHLELHYKIGESITLTEISL